MDAYNQGYSKGIEHNKTQIDLSTLTGQSNTDEDGEEYGAGFYAVAYTITDGSGIDGLSTGQTVISYRGTDNLVAEFFQADVDIFFNGNIGEPQLIMASEFFSAVKALETTDAILLTDSAASSGRSGVSSCRTAG